MSIKSYFSLTLSILIPLLLSSCASIHPGHTTSSYQTAQVVSRPADYSSRLPQHLATHEKTILIDPRVHAWGAYDSSGNLIRSGLTTAGGSWCSDIKRSCKTRSGSFRIQSLGHAGCKSSIYPLHKPGAPMPYCMFFNGHQGLHGSSQVVEGNISHGCVRMRTADAEWIRFNFARIGTKVIVRPY